MKRTLFVGNSAGDSESIINIVKHMLKNGYSRKDIIILATSGVARDKLISLKDSITFQTLDDVLGPDAIAKYKDAALEDIDVLMLHVWMQASEIEVLYIGVPSHSNCQVHFQIADEFRRLKNEQELSPKIYVYLDYAFLEIRHAFYEAIQRNEKWVSVAHFLFPFLVAKTLYCALNTAIEKRAVVVGHLRVDELRGEAVASQETRDILEQNDVDCEQMILFSGGKAVDTDIATMTALLGAIKQGDNNFNVVIGLHPGVSDYCDYVVRMQGLIQSHQVEARVRIVAWPEKLKADVDTKYLITHKISGDTLERFASAGVVGSDPAQLLLKHVLNGGVAWTASEKPTFVDGFMSGSQGLMLFAQKEQRQQEGVMSREQLGIPDLTLAEEVFRHLRR